MIYFLHSYILILVIWSYILRILRLKSKSKTLKMVKFIAQFKFPYESTQEHWMYCYCFFPIGSFLMQWDFFVFMHQLLTNLFFFFFFTWALLIIIIIIYSSYSNTDRLCRYLVYFHNEIKWHYFSIFCVQNYNWKPKLWKKTFSCQA